MSDMRRVEVLRNEPDIIIRAFYKDSEPDFVHIQCLRIDTGGSNNVTLKDIGLRRSELEETLKLFEKGSEHVLDRCK